MAAKDFKSDFSITIDFNKDSPNPGRIFQAMASIISAFEQLDKDLIASIDSRIEPVLLLEDVEKGSLKTWLAYFIRSIPDGAINDLDWKQLIGHYLVKCKYIVLRKLDGKIELTDAKDIEDIQYEIIEEARKTDVRSLHDYAPISAQKIVKHISQINEALQPLSSKDNARIGTSEGDVSFNLSLKIDREMLEDLITADRIENEATMILKVKKPDYLGQSQWDFKHGHRTISSKILDTDWLGEFQDRKHDVRPGDSIKARVKTTLKYGHDQTLIGTTYDITKVLQIIRQLPGRQASLHDEEE